MITLIIKGSIWQMKSKKLLEFVWDERIQFQIPEQ